MILEVATIDVQSGMGSDFEKGVAEALPLFRRARGYRSIRLERGIENPTRYHLVVEWETIEDHVVHFRNSVDFQAWRSLVGHTFSRPPSVEHVAVVLSDCEGQHRTS